MPWKCLSTALILLGLLLGLGSPLAVSAAKEKGKKEPTDELQGRRCLFHGALAVSACPNCNSMLCKECQAGGRCPRCGLVLGERARKEEGPPAPAEPEERDWSRL